jgi:hypothetical protein
MKGQLVVGYNQSGSPITVPIVATGGGIRDLRILTSRLDLGIQPVGGPPGRGFIKLDSRGTAAAWLDAYTMVGANPDDFGFDAPHSTCRSLGAIPPGMSCTLPVTFEPLAAGTRQGTAVLRGGTFVKRATRRAHLSDRVDRPGPKTLSHRDSFASAFP